MKIVFVSKECPPSPQSYGIGTYVWETSGALARLGHDVTIIAASDDGKPAPVTSLTPALGVTVIRLPDDELAVANRSRLSYVLSALADSGIAYRRRVAECIESIIGRQQPDIIEFPGHRGESLIWLEHRQLPMVVRMHGMTAGIDASWKDHLYAARRLQLRWERNEFKAADTITVVSEQAAQYVRAEFGADRVRVVYNSIDTARWRKLAAYGSQEVEGNDILFVGSLSAKKGLFTLLRAATHLRQNGWRGRLILAGRTTPPFERALRLRATLGYKLPDWVVRLGTCERDRLAGFYRSAGVCCFPSFHEAFGYTCLEAMACGGLVVGSSGTGMAETVTDQCGWLVRPGDVSALAAALNSALSTRDEERQRMMKSAQQRARDFDHDTVIPQLLRIYEETRRLYRSREFRPYVETVQPMATGA